MANRQLQSNKAVASNAGSVFTRAEDSVAGQCTSARHSVSVVLIAYGCCSVAGCRPRSQRCLAYWPCCLRTARQLRGHGSHAMAHRTAWVLLRTTLLLTRVCTAHAGRISAAHDSSCRCCTAQ